eukprot:3184791-Rhodomonas_salina.4
MSAPDVGYAAARCTLQQTRSGSKGQPPLVPGRAHAPLSFLRSQVFDRSSTDIACVDTGTGIYLPTRALCDAPILTWRMVLPAYGELTAWVSVFTEVADRAMRTLRDAVAHVGMLLPGIFS